MARGCILGIFFHVIWRDRAAFDHHVTGGTFPELRHPTQNREPGNRVSRTSTPTSHTHLGR